MNNDNIHIKWTLAIIHKHSGAHLYLTICMSKSELGHFPPVMCLIQVILGTKRDNEEKTILLSGFSLKVPVARQTLLIYQKFTNSQKGMASSSWRYNSWLTVLEAIEELNNDFDSRDHFDEGSGIDESKKDGNMFARLMKKFLGENDDDDMNLAT